MIMCIMYDSSYICLNQKGKSILVIHVLKKMYFSDISALVSVLKAS